MLYHKIIPIEYIHSCLRIVQAACEGRLLMIWQNGREKRILWVRKSRCVLK